eukprot:scaffold10284_cov118-Isochrysis_galbana.AAC.16
MISGLDGHSADTQRTCSAKSGCTSRRRVPCHAARWDPWACRRAPRRTKRQRQCALRMSTSSSELTRSKSNKTGSKTKEMESGSAAAHGQRLSIMPIRSMAASTSCARSSSISHASGALAPRASAGHT